MKKREKILAGVIVGFLAIFALGFGVKGVFLKPIKELDKQTAGLREKLNKVRQERRDYFDAEDNLRKIARRTFTNDMNQASARCGEMISKEIALAGLSESDFTRLPANPRKLKGACEIGWSIQGKGDLNRIINLIFLLENSPRIHRIEGVTLTANEKPGEIRVRFVYLTLVLDPTPEFDPVELKPKFTLESPERFAYNTVRDRDILRPYIKATPVASTPGASPARSPGPETLRVVSLSEWEGQPEVHIRDLANNKTLRYRPGEKLNDETEVVAVDYRALPSSRNPLLKSDSRVILKIGSDFWAVERGQTLADKRKLADNQWPVR